MISLLGSRRTATAARGPSCSADLAKLRLRAVLAAHRSPARPPAESADGVLQRLLAEEPDAEERRPS